TRRHRQGRGDPGLPRRRQDRHRAHRQRRRLLAPLRRVLRRRGAGGEPALLDGGGGDGSGSQPPRLLRRPRRGPRVPQRDGRRAAPDGRAAGRHRDLAGRAGQGAGEVARDRGRPAMSRAMPLSRLLPDVAAVPPSLEITGLVLDSRSIAPGDAFVAIGGFGTHGLHFVDQARAAGAAAILFEPPVPADVPAAPADAIAVPGLRARWVAMSGQFPVRPSRAMAMVGVTGTSGKTSTVQLLAQAWTLLGTPAGTVGTLGAGLYGETVATGFTTPLVLQMHALLAQLR